MIVLFRAFVHACVNESCLTFCDPLVCSLSGVFRQNIEVGAHFLLQAIFPTQDLNPHLLHWQGGFFITEPSEGWSIWGIL